MIKLIKFGTVMGVAVLGMMPGAALAAGDPVAGAQQFKQKCAMCHSVTVGEKKTAGPNLAAVMGRKAASGDFRYSPALVKSQIKWDIVALDAYLAGPSKKVPGTRMFTAVPDAKVRQNIIAYLGGVKK